MSVYWMTFYREILDEEKLKAYAALARPALEAAGGTFLASGLPEAVFDGGAIMRTTLIRFESIEVARAAYASPAYREALAALDGGVVREIRVMPAL